MSQYFKKTFISFVVMAFLLVLAFYWYPTFTVAWQMTAQGVLGVVVGLVVYRVSRSQNRGSS